MAVRDARAVTRDDVARLAGVSAAVVSYVVNEGPKRVAPDTATRVREAIRLLGYRPNAAARALRLGASEMLGFALPDASNPFFAQLAQAVGDAAASCGRTVLLTNSDGDPAKERGNIRNLSSRRVDGVLTASPLIGPRELADLMDTAVPIVFLNRDSPVAGYDTIGVDFRHAARGAVEHLVGHGHQNIALVMGTHSVSGEADGRELGWLDALTAADLPEGPVMRAPFTLEGGYQAGLRLLASASRPTAVFASSDLQAIGVLRALNEAGIAVPEEMALVGFDGITETEYSWPPLTTVKQPVRDMAEAAVARLLEPDAEKSHTIFPTELVIRRSCGCPAAL